jgi:hypothetical protein
MAKETSEEQAKKEAEQKAYNDRLSTLKSLMVYAGARELNGESNKFGEIGAKAGKLGYATFVTSPEADKYRKAIYAGKMEEYNQSGTVAMPEYATNYELEKMALALIDDASSRVKFSDLEKIVTESNKECKFKVPEKFKGLTAEQVQIKIKKKAEESKAKGEKYKPSEEENDAMVTYQTLMEAYNLGAAFKMVQGYYMNGVNQTSEVLNEKYKPKEEKKKE